MDIQKIKWYIANLNPMAVRRLFIHVRNFSPADPIIKGLKYAIYYGRLYFEPSQYVNGTLDLKSRSRMVDRIIAEYTHPTTRLDMIESLIKARNGVLQADAHGFFSCGNNDTLNAIEAEHYSDAMNSLDILIKAVSLYPFTWRKIFSPC